MSIYRPMVPDSVIITHPLGLDNNKTMAKSEFPCLASSSSSPRHRKSSALPSKQAKPSPRSRRTPSSPTILALLAAISVSPFPVYAHPFDPPDTSLPFLYPPSILQPKPTSTPTPPLPKRSVTPAAQTLASTAAPSPPSPSACSLQRTGLPDKYVLGDDGFWHKTEWSLYGISQCTVSKLSSIPNSSSLPLNLSSLLSLGHLLSPSRSCTK
jgi:hypothetical protein